MIRSEDLRIGNWINYRGLNTQLKRSMLVDILQNVNVSFSRPIPLTEEILLESGFEKDYDEIFLDNVYLKYFNDELFYSGFTGYKVSDEPILYVHQIQNLFHCLQGKELEINGL